MFDNGVSFGIISMDEHAGAMEWFAEAQLDGSTPEEFGDALRKLVVDDWKADPLEFLYMVEYKMMETMHMNYPYDPWLDGFETGYHAGFGDAMMTNMPPMTGDATMPPMTGDATMPPMTGDATTPPMTGDANMPPMTAQKQ